MAMQYEAILRLAVFLGLFALFALLEALIPRRNRVQGRLPRWTTNLAMVALGTALLRLLALALPFLAVGAAVDAWRHGMGLFNQLAWPLWVEVLLALLIFDLALWAQHLVTHKVPLFWRFHRVHHADRDLDATTGLRFHPFEIAASMGLKIALVYLIGPQPIAVLLFELILNGSSLFNHANLKLPHWLDAALRLLVVTPDMHLVHHSQRQEEHDSNYGFGLSVWDRIFGTYRAKAVDGVQGMVVGLEWQDERPKNLIWSLLLPFRR
jgi:sterol desaturase/sphingolipid hydroxylase (fatty acid hydroxylase superfamily)